MANFIFLISFNTQSRISLLHLSYPLLENIVHNNEMGYKVMNVKLNMKQRREKTQTGICNRLDIFNL